MDGCFIVFFASFSCLERQAVGREPSVCYTVFGRALIEGGRRRREKAFCDSSTAAMHRNHRTSVFRDDVDDVRMTRLELL